MNLHGELVPGVRIHLSDARRTQRCGRALTGIVHPTVGEQVRCDSGVVIKICGVIAVVVLYSRRDAPNIPTDLFTVRLNDVVGAVVRERRKNLSREGVRLGNCPLRSILLSIRYQQPGSTARMPLRGRWCQELSTGT